VGPVRTFPVTRTNRDLARRAGCRSSPGAARCSITVTQHLAPNVDTVVACAEGVDAVNRETSLELRIGLLENEVERLRLQLIVLTKALAKVIRILTSR
jgi:hypothetical protein